MKFAKLAVRKLLRTIHPDLEEQWVEQYHFNQLKRPVSALQWQSLTPAPFARLDAGMAHIGPEMFVFGGFLWGGKVRQALDIYHLEQERWTESIDLPSGMAQTHLGIAHDQKRYIYIISGQLGTNCRPATTNCFVFDIQTSQFHSFLPLPQVRYAAVVQLIHNRLHVFAGAKEDRNTSALDHWSVEVVEGKAKGSWQTEPSVPKGGPHRASIVEGNYIYMFGGQEGDYVAIPGDPEFTCTPTLSEEFRVPDVYRYDTQFKIWERMADMPLAVSHTEASIVRIKDTVLIVGGDDARIGKTDVVTTVDEIQAYNLKSNTWRTIGQLPYKWKACVAVYYKGYLYVTGGQRNRALHDPVTLNRYERVMWKTKVDLSLL